MNNIHKSWKEKLGKEFKEAEGILLQLSKKHQENGIEIYPVFKDVFKVYEMPLDEVKVVILGEEPYNDKPWANGLAWGNKQPFTQPEEIRRIHKAVEIRSEEHTSE